LKLLKKQGGKKFTIGYYKILKNYLERKEEMRLQESKALKDIITGL